MTGRPQRGVPTVACRDRECYKRLVVGKILEPEIRSMIEARDFAALREVFREWPPADVAEVILDLPEDEQVIIFRVEVAFRFMHRQRIVGANRANAARQQRLNHFERRRVAHVIGTLLEG